jgi:uracil-DNA glycosylase family protein
MAARVPQATAAPLIPPRPTLDSLRAAAAGCRACDLWKLGTQTVFGDGARHASLMLVGEQPGDQEDKQGKPFVGPAGAMLDKALEAAGIDPADTYVTNAVKHFKWEPRGKRRIHKKPDMVEVYACHPWLESEIDVVHPRAIVCLGATATRAVLGTGVKVMQDRGRVLDTFPSLAPIVAVTVHPSSILRAPDAEARRQAMEQFVADLKIVAAALRAGTARGRQQGHGDQGHERHEGHERSEGHEQEPRTTRATRVSRAARSGGR